MQRIANPWTSVRLRARPPYFQLFDRRWLQISPGGEIGRRKGLKIPRWKHRAGSIPALGTIFKINNLHTIVNILFN